jgi:hypothetical protein
MTTGIKVMHNFQFVNVNIPDAVVVIWKAPRGRLARVLKKFWGLATESFLFLFNLWSWLSQELLMLLRSDSFPEHKPESTLRMTGPTFNNKTI